LVTMISMARPTQEGIRHTKHLPFSLERAPGELEWRLKFRPVSYLAAAAFAFASFFAFSAMASEMAFLALALYPLRS
jgi:hypothetical protein